MLSCIFMISFVAFVIILFSFVIRILIRGISIFAKPPINPALFIIAKICAFSSCFFIPAGIIRPDLKLHVVPEWLSLLAAPFFFSGLAVAVIAMKKLGDDLIFGLPEGTVKSLKTDGIFRISRNPLYLGFILLILSSCLITPNPVNFVSAAVAIALHHRIILREEVFLLSKPGDEYRNYMKTTGRYLMRF